MLHEARMTYPILSNTGTGGYYLPENKEEAIAFQNLQLSYISNINKTLPPVRRYIENKGQRRFSFE
jgi:hypothetical protein